MADAPDGTSDRDRWCPSCRAHRKWYLTECPECGTPLVDVATEEAPDPDLPLTPVFDIKDGAILPLATMALDDAGIEYAIRAANVIIPGVARGSEHTGFDKLVPGEILVRAEDAVRARDLLADLEKAGTPDPGAYEPTTAEWTRPASQATDDNAE
jgi:hypothetical protein